MPELVDMRKAQKGGYMKSSEAATMGPEEDYPHGLKISLEKEQIDALNMMDLPKVGKACKIMAMGVVTESSAEPGGKNPEVTIQITSLLLIPEGSESDEKPEESGDKPSTILGNAYRGSY